MDLTPWKPFGELTNIRNEMNELLNRFLGESRPSLRRGEEWWQPLVDISETEDNVLVKAELPGLGPKDVNISLLGDTLTIKGEKKTEKEEKEEQYHFVERYEGTFQRTFRLPANIKRDQIDATFDKGILKISIPKTEETKAKQIEIKVK